MRRLGITSRHPSRAYHCKFRLKCPDTHLGRSKDFDCQNHELRGKDKNLL